MIIRNSPRFANEEMQAAFDKWNESVEGDQVAVCVPGDHVVRKTLINVGWELAKRLESLEAAVEDAAARIVSELRDIESAVLRRPK